ncbi:SDR family NAD(P)-dependent oxidoreductase [Microbacterium sp. NPDC089695]|uniref:SDR family NAD(P)-dependent oxidoreductase n=1 Tax=Microbacterium sp. NPDC089695 TaxID=3364198 RepID=UPI0037F4D23C
MSRFEERIVMVVGGGRPESGDTLGSAAALSYAREGAAVVVVDHDRDAAQRTVDDAAAEGISMTAQLADVRAEDQVEAAVAAVVERHGRIDVLHNNVGSTLMGLPPDVSLSDWDRSLRLNLGSVFLTAKAVLPHMVAQGRGAIVNISSVASLRYTGYPYPAYSAAKAAVNQLTAVLAVEYARHGIRVNAVAPGVISTPLMFREIADQYGSVDEMLRARDALTPRGRMGTPWDVAAAALFLASDDAEFVNGVILPVDGGHHVKMM